MRRPRFRVRTLMIAVAVVALMLGAEIIGGRWLRYRRLARSHGDYARDARETGRDCRASYAGLLDRSRRATAAGDGARAHAYAVNAASMAGVVERQGRMSAYHDRLGRKYARAARYPWLPVAPDPHRPE